MPSAISPEGNETPNDTPNQDAMIVETETKDESHTIPDPVVAEAEGDHDDGDAMDEDLPMVDAEEKKEEDAVVKLPIAPDSQDVKLEDLFADDDSDPEFTSKTARDIKIPSSPPEAPASPV